MTLFWKRSRLAVLISATIVLSALTALEWVTSSAIGADLSTNGLLSGIAMAGLLFALLLLMPSMKNEMVASATASLIAVTELALGTIVIFVLSASSVSMLPRSITGYFMQGDAATDFILFSFLGLALLVATRAWLRYAEQLGKASTARLEAVQAQATLAERDRALVQSEMMLLRAQIEPHFLWNTLSHVKYLAIKSPTDAAAMTGHLIRYLRAAVPRIHGDASTLGAEIDSVQAYLEIMKIRMGERLTTSIDIPPALSEIPFAPLLLQTLVENAIKHGIEPKMGPVSISVSAGIDSEHAGRIFIDVRDNGVGLQAKPSTTGTGLGLRNVRERLTHLYGQTASLSIVGVPQGGVVARITIPITVSQLSNTPCSSRLAPCVPAI